MGRGFTGAIFVACMLLAMGMSLPLRASAGEWAGVAFPQKAPQGVMAWVVLPTRMVSDDADLPGATPEHPPLPYVFHAARNEYECAQLIVMLGKPLSGVSVEFAGDFSTATWKANKLGVVPGTWPKRAAAPLTQTWSYTGTTSGRIPDPLLPDPTFDLDAGINRVWLTVHVPKDTKPGDYHGSVRIRTTEKALLELPLSLRVWQHALPDESSLPVLADVLPHTDFFKSIDDRSLWEHLKPYYDDLRSHRINGTGEIYPAPIWHRDQPPPADLQGYEQALKYVLDDLKFARFRFPHMADAIGGKWDGINVFEAPRPEQLARAEGGMWISGSSFSQSEPPDWGRAGGATLAAYKEKSAAWVEYQFDSRFAADDPVYIWLQVQPNQAKERKIISLDGKELGTLHGSDFAANPLRFACLPQPLKITPGKHTLRVDVDDVVGATDPLYGIYLTAAADPDLDQLVRDATELSPDFKAAFGYNAKQTGDWLRQRGWLKKSHAKLANDPTALEYGRVANLYDFVGDVLPSVRRELGGVPEMTLRKSVEVWTSSLSAEPFEPDHWRDTIKPTDELWTRHDVLHTIGYPGIAMRLIPWIVARHGFNGYVFGVVNDWREDPWRQTGQNNGFLRGTLIYPDPKTGKPIDSARWELLREGLEDFETFRMLQTAVDGAPAGASHITEARHLLEEELPAMVKDARTFSWDCAALESLHTRAGELLSELTAASASH